MSICVRFAFSVSGLDAISVRSQAEASPLDLAGAMALSFQMAGSVGLLSYLSLKIRIFSLLSVFSFFSMASLMKFESVLMTLLMSVLSLLSVMCYFSIKNIQNVQKFNRRAEIHLNTAAS